MNLYISNPENVELPPENSVNIFIDSETSTLKGKMDDSSILEFSKTIEVEPDFSSMGITVTSKDVKAGKYFIDSTGILIEGSLNESNIATSSNQVTLTSGFIDETQTIQVGTLYSGSTELTPGTEDQTLDENTFINENIIIKGDSNLLAENIKEGIVIFGVSGTYAANSSDSSSTESSDIVSLLNLPRAISEYTNDNIGEIISIPYTNESGIISGPIEFEVVGVNHHKDINDESKPTITLMSKNSIRHAAFDAKEPNNPNSDRADYGNNRWSVSNIRQWLNSEGTANSWFTAQHEYDVEPNSSNVESAQGAYSDEAGFLAGFGDEIKQHFAIVRNKTILCDADKLSLSKDFDETEDKVFLPSYTEMGYGDLDSNNPEGSALSGKFIDYDSRYEFTFCLMRSLKPASSINVFCVEPYSGNATSVSAYSDLSYVFPLLVLC